MTLAAVPAPPATMASRFFLVGFLPTYTALLVLLVMIWAADGRGTSFTRAWQVAGDLTAAQIVFILLLTLLVAVLLVPFQLGLVRVLEGAWPAWLGGGWSTRRQLRHSRALAKASMPAAADDLSLWTAGTAGYRLRQRYPVPEHLVRATRLGNVLAAMEDRAGRDYGLDAVIAWPRLYPLLGAEVKAVVDDRRNTLDYLARFAVSAFVTAVATFAIMWGEGWWLLLVLAPAVGSWLAYLGALRAALAYGESVQTAFDLHHVDFGARFGLERPASPEAERRAHRELCDLWRQGVPPSFTYAPAPDQPRG